MEQKTKYKWGDFGIVGGMDAQTVGDTLEALRTENSGALTPDIVVESARPKDSPLHNCFEWDDSIAGEKYRKEQARRIIQCVVTVIRDDNPNPGPQTIRAFTSVKDDKGCRYYTTTAYALSDDELKKQVFANLIRDMDTLRRKYDAYKFAEVHSVFKTIDRVITKIRRPGKTIKRAGSGKKKIERRRQTAQIGV